MSENWSADHWSATSTKMPSTSLLSSKGLCMVLDPLVFASTYSRSPPRCECFCQADDLLPPPSTSASASSLSSSSLLRHLNQMVTPGFR